MKTFAGLAFAPFALAALGMMPAVSLDASNSTGGAYCGVGYTYCGYILKEQKNFDEATILTAYCAGGYCDSAAGTTKTDPLQALFVCLPQAAIPKRDEPDDEPYTGPVKIELLCACSGDAFGGGKNVCLNPDGDHIGRCSSPCLNSGP